MFGSDNAMLRGEDGMPRMPLGKPTKTPASGSPAATYGEASRKIFFELEPEEKLVLWLMTRVYWYPGQRRYSRREILADAVVNLGGLVGGSSCLFELLSKPAPPS